MFTVSLCVHWIFTVRNEVAKVMFLLLSVILFTGGGVPGQVPPRNQVHPPGLGTPPRSGTPRQVPPGQVHPRQVHPPGQVHPPSSRRLLLRTVRILLECILVTCTLTLSSWLSMCRSCSGLFRPFTRLTSSTLR